MQMSQVGRDQAIEKDAPAQASSLAQEAAKAKAQAANEGVTGAENAKADSGPDPVKERKGRPRGQQPKESEAAGEESEPEGEKDEEVVRDPSLGNRVDLSG
jgi:hypothetical protein